MEQSVDNIVSLNVAANPTGKILGLGLPTPSHEVPLSPNETNNTKENETPLIATKRTNTLRKRRRKDKVDNPKMAKLADKNTEALEKLTSAVENLTAAVVKLSDIIENNKTN